MATYAKRKSLSATAGVVMVLGALLSGCGDGDATSESAASNDSSTNDSSTDDKSPAGDVTTSDDADVGGR